MNHVMRASSCLGGRVWGCLLYLMLLCILCSYINKRSYLYLYLCVPLISIQTPFENERKSKNLFRTRKHWKFFVSERLDQECWNLKGRARLLIHTCVSNFRSLVATIFRPSVLNIDQNGMISFGNTNISGPERNFYDVFVLELSWVLLFPSCLLTKFKVNYISSIINKITDRKNHDFSLCVKDISNLK